MLKASRSGDSLNINYNNNDNLNDEFMNSIIN